MFKKIIQYGLLCAGAMICLMSFHSANTEGPTETEAATDIPTQTDAPPEDQEPVTQQDKPTSFPLSISPYGCMACGMG
ncbi:MAG: hypothetical protein H6857_01770 [Rhodospirillales bacterium]|nr:hypothetical protein [Rhodospirillales bacterium]